MPEPLKPDQARACPPCRPGNGATASGSASVSVLGEVAAELLDGGLDHLARHVLC